MSRPPLSEVRRAKVAELLQASGAVTVNDLQARFGVSPMTARRDLAILAERGIARRAHGGAVLPSREHSFRERLGAAPEAKARLAEAAFALLAPRESVFLDASSTTCFVARLIRERGLPVRVVTNSLPVLHELLDASKLSARGRQAIAPVGSVSLVLADMPDKAAERLRELGATVRSP